MGFWEWSQQAYTWLDRPSEVAEPTVENNAHQGRKAEHEGKGRQKMKKYEEKGRRGVMVLEDWTRHMPRRPRQGPCSSYAPPKTTRGSTARMESMRFHARTRQTLIRRIQCLCSTIIHWQHGNQLLSSAHNNNIILQCWRLTQHETNASNIHRVMELT